MLPELGDFTDEQLFLFLKEDNKGAFNEIYNRYWASLFNQAYKRLGSRELTEEVLQDLFTKLWLNRQQINISHSVAAYLAVSVKYLVLNQLEKEAVRKKFARTHQPLTNANLTEEAILFNELGSLVTQEVEKLPEKCQSVFVLSRYEQYSNKDIAQELNISEKTVENHISKAIKILKVNLKESIVSVLLLGSGIF